MIINRRQWTVGGAALVAELAAGPVMANTTPSKLIGIQLYTVRELFAADPVATLKKIAAIGYREVEFGGGGYEKMDHAALRSTLERNGLTAPSLHVGYEALLTNFGGSVKMAKTLGADTVVVPWVAETQRTAEGWRIALANFSRWAKQLAQVRLGFAYHNHDFEFTTKIGGTSLFDRLIDETDPALVKLELDLFWAIAVGEDPKAIIRRQPGRIYAYHVKDRTLDGKMTSVGNGVIDFADIFSLNRIAGVKHFFVENDNAPAPYLPDITTSFRALSRLHAQTDL